MIEKIIQSFLKKELNLPVFFEYPEKELDEFIVIEKTSSTNHNKLDSSTFAIQTYSKSLYEVAELNCMVKEKMKEIIVLDEIVSSKLNSDYNFTNVQSKKYRYQAVYDIRHY